MIGAGYEKLWGWFGLSRASFCVMPRVLMHEMPDEWQGRMADLLREYEATFDTGKLPSCKVLALGVRNRFAEWPGWLLNYRRPDVVAVDAIRQKPCEDCGRLGHECRCADELMAEIIANESRPSP